MTCKRIRLGFTRSTGPKTRRKRYKGIAIVIGLHIFAAVGADLWHGP